MDSPQSPSLHEERRISTTEPPVGHDVSGEQNALSPDAAPQRAPLNPTTLALSTKSLEFMRQVEALAHDIAVVSRRDSSDQHIKIQERSSFSGGLETVEPPVRVSPRDQLLIYRPSIGRQTFLTLANFLITVRDQLVSYGRLFGSRIIQALTNFFIPVRDRLVSYKPLFGRQTILALATFSIMALISVAATFAWQFSTAKSRNDVAVAEKQPGFTSVGQASLQDGPPQAGPVAQTAPTASPPAMSPEFVQQLETVTRDLVGLRRSVDEFASKQEQLAATQAQLAAKQEQMAQTIAKPQAVKRNITPTMSSPPRRNAPPKHPAQAASAPHPEPKPRPPLPLSAARR